MLEGVHILSETTKYTVSVSALICGIIMILPTIFFLFFVIEAIKDKSIGGIIGCLIAMIIFGGTSIIDFYSYATRNTYKEYKVTIDNSVKMNDFNSKYNTISIEGKIYKITLKEEN